MHQQSRLHGQSNAHLVHSHNNQMDRLIAVDSNAFDFMRRRIAITVDGQIALHLVLVILLARQDGIVIDEHLFGPDFVHIKRDKLHVLVQALVNMCCLEDGIGALVLKFHMTLKFIAPPTRLHISIIVRQFLTILRDEFKAFHVIRIMVLLILALHVLA